MEWLKRITHREVMYRTNDGEVWLKRRPRIKFVAGFDVCQFRYAFQVLWGLREEVFEGEQSYCKEFRIVWLGWPIKISYLN